MSKRGSYASFFGFFMLISLFLAIFSFSTNKELSMFSFLEGFSNLKLSSISDFTRELNDLLKSFYDFISFDFSSDPQGWELVLSLLKSFYNFFIGQFKLYFDVAVALLNFVVSLFGDVVSILSFILNFLY